MGLFSFLFGSSNESEAKEPEHAVDDERDVCGVNGFAYTVLAVETANRSKSSICRIALASYSDTGEREFKSSFLVNPKSKTFSFSSKNGITYDMCKNEKTLDELWPRIERYFNGRIVCCHWSPFVIGTLLATLKKYKITPPDFYVIDTHDLAKTLYPKASSYKLEDIAELAGLPYSDTDTLGKLQVIECLIKACSTSHSRLLKSHELRVKNGRFDYVSDD